MTAAGTSRGARHGSPPEATARTFLHVAELLPAEAGSQRDQVLALTATTASATALRSDFQKTQRPANAETAVKVAGATARHSIVLHGASSFLSGEKHAR